MPFYKDISLWLLKGRGCSGVLNMLMYDRGSKGLRCAQSHNLSKKLLHKAAYLPRKTFWWKNYAIKLSHLGTFKYYCTNVWVWFWMLHIKRAKSPVFQSSTKLSRAEPYLIAINKNIKFRKELASNKNTILFRKKKSKKCIQIKKILENFCLVVLKN